MPEPRFSHLGPAAAFVQSAAVVQPQKLATESPGYDQGVRHTGPRGLPVQSAVV
jgi:hypothetical protein